MNTESPFLRLRVSAELRAAIDAEAQRLKVRPSDVVRYALASYFENPGFEAMREPGRPKTKAD